MHFFAFILLWGIKRFQTSVFLIRWSMTRLQAIMFIVLWLISRVWVIVFTIRLWHDGAQTSDCIDNTFLSQTNEFLVRWGLSKLQLVIFKTSLSIKAPTYCIHIVLFYLKIPTHHTDDICEAPMRPIHCMFTTLVDLWARNRCTHIILEYQKTLNYYMYNALVDRMAHRNS